MTLLDRMKQHLGHPDRDDSGDGGQHDVLAADHAERPRGGTDDGQDGGTERHSHSQSGSTEHPAGESGIWPSSDAEAERLMEGVPGAKADRPQDIPKAGWWQIVKRGWKEGQTDQVSLLAAGVAFYAFLAIFPALIALVLVYGLVASPSEVVSQINGLGAAVPDDVRSLLTKQGLALASKKSSSLGLGLAASVLLSLWSASSGTGHLITAVNTAYDEQETRSWVRRKALALVLTLGAFVFVVLAIALIAALPVVLRSVHLSGAASIGAQVVRWVLLLGAISVALAVMYRVAPSRDAPKLRWVSVGAGAATALWLLISVGFTLYSRYGHYGSSYGSLVGVVVLLMWLWLTAYAILLGAEVNAEAEAQTVRDTTKGPAQPIGTRNAFKADTVLER